MSSYFRILTDTWLELAPWMLLGAVVAGVLHVLLPVDWLRRHLSGRSGILKAVLTGVPLPLCSCGVIPVAVSLKRSGVSDSAVVAFLISTPQTGVDSVLVSANFLGWPFALLKVFAAGITGIIGGEAVARLPASKTATADPLQPDHVTSKSVSTPQSERTPGSQPVGSGLLNVISDIPVSPSPPDTGSSGGADVHAETQPGSKDRRSPMALLTEAIRHGDSLILAIWKWLIIGVAASALIAWLVPAGSISQFQGLSGIFGLLVALLISMPLYICATASVPLAASLVVGGLSPGAAMVILMAGPATNAATLGTVYRVLGRRVLFLYLLTLIAGSLTAGAIFDSLISRDSMNALRGHHHEGLWAAGCGLILLLMVIRHAVVGVRRSLRFASTSADLRIDVSGMTCDGCAAGLAEKLRRLDGVSSADVSFAAAEARISGNTDRAAVDACIRKAGYEPK